jgi:glycerophosphoryl diester phosphodiesterase
MNSICSILPLVATAWVALFTEQNACGNLSADRMPGALPVEEIEARHWHDMPAFFPSLPGPRHGDTYVVAHRGAHGDIPENSLPAYRRAIQLGCDFVEIDVRRTRDGKIVSVHNSRIDAYVQGDTGLVSNFTLAQLKAMDIGWAHGPEWKGTTVPTVEEIFGLCRGRIGIYLDLKEPLVRELVPLIQKFGMEKEVVWYIPADREEVIRDLREQCPDCLPMPDPGDAGTLPDVLAVWEPSVIATDMGALSAVFVRRCHDSEAMVFVDERQGGEVEWKYILSLGTDGIQTDDPEGLIRFLNSPAR